MAPTSASLLENDDDDEMVDNHRSNYSDSDLDLIDTNWNSDLELEEDEDEDEQEEENEEEDEEEEEEEEEAEEEISSSSVFPNSLTVILKDPDVLDCPICFLPLTIPVFQCNNGHIACSGCCCKIKNVCPSCSLSIRYNRCRAIENVIESIKIPCTNTKYGCKETTSYNKKHEHEIMCIHEPCSCPHRGCDFVASSKLLYLHYYRAHGHSGIPFNYNIHFTVPVKNDMEYVVLRERANKTLFVLNYAVESIGNVASIACISPSSVKKGFSYELVARKGNSNIKLKSFTECMPKWSEYIPHGEFLLVPTDFLDRHSLHVRIRSA
ncbi:RING-type E3 ubiquitin transferase [Heracleum sosnowskyi]|uniref:RING-type E3 ubiquitin transferase n=1 Tax=Heracleum sosnowskyi TaxID=360622 RepID=A0AAD8IC39_9APIA|nr:RING-type E3 ubiquitin transferase [Heracleum sosnowskyi]